jgi:hypothetical protein
MQGKRGDAVTKTDAATRGGTGAYSLRSGLFPSPRPHVSAALCLSIQSQVWGSRVGKIHRASCLSHFKSRFFNLRDTLCKSQAGSIKVWQDMSMIKGRRCS